MRVLVTGCTGFVGQVVAARLRADGHRVIGLARHQPESFSNDRIAVDIGDPRVVDLVRASVEPCEAIVHTAAAIDMHADTPSISLVNCWGTQAMVSLAHAWAADRFVYISSIGVIGTPVQIPIKEDHPTNPLSAYHASKLYGEQLVRIAALGGLEAVSLRITAPVGPGMPPGRILSVFVERALHGDELLILGHGTRRQNFVDVRDIAGAVTACLRRDASGVLNIGGKRSVSNYELGTMCTEVLGSASTIRFHGSDNEEGLVWDVSSAQAEEVVGYSPQYGMEDSIRAVAAEHT